MPWGELATGGWAHLVALGPRGSSPKNDIKLGNWKWRAGKIEAAGRFFEPSEDKTNASRAALSAHRKPHSGPKRATTTRTTSGSISLNVCLRATLSSVCHYFSILPQACSLMASQANLTVYHSSLERSCRRLGAVSYINRTNRSSVSP